MTSAHPAPNYTANQPARVTWIYAHASLAAFLLHLKLYQLDEESTVWCHPDDPEDWSTYTNEDVVIYNTKGTLNEVSAIARWASHGNIAVQVLHTKPISTRIICPREIYVLATHSLETYPVTKLALGHLVWTETAKQVFVPAGESGYFTYTSERKPPCSRVTAVNDELDRENRALARTPPPKCINCTTSLVQGEETLCSLCVMAYHRRRA